MSEHNLWNEASVNGIVVLSMATISSVGVGIVTHSYGHSWGWGVLLWPFAVLIMREIFALDVETTLRPQLRTKAPCICGTVFEISGPCLAKEHKAKSSRPDTPAEQTKASSLEG